MAVKGEMKDDEKILMNGIWSPENVRMPKRKRSRRFSRKYPIFHPGHDFEIDR